MSSPGDSHPHHLFIRCLTHIYRLCAPNGSCPRGMSNEITVMASKGAAQGGGGDRQRAMPLGQDGEAQVLKLALSSAFCVLGALSALHMPLPTH